MANVTIKDKILSKTPKNNNDVQKESNKTSKPDLNKEIFKPKENNLVSKSLDISLEEFREAKESTIDTDVTPKSAVTPIESDYFNYDYEDNGSKNGVIEYSKQRKTGDCWLLSGINAMSYCEKGREIIKNALEYHDGYTTVHTMAGDYDVTDEELGIVRGLDEIYNQYSSGDDDMLIMELAMEKVCDDAANKNFIIDYSKFNLMSALKGNKATTPSNSSLEGGWSGVAMYLLSGNTCKMAQDVEEENQFLDEFASDKAKNIAMTTSFKKEVELNDLAGNKIRLVDDHEYAIKEVSDNSVVLVNPHDSSKEIIISRNDFLENAINMEKTDFSDDSSKQNLIYYPSESYEEKVKDSTYDVQTYTDKNGNLISKAYTPKGISYGIGVKCDYDENGEVVSSYMGVYDAQDINNCIELSKEETERIFDRQLLNYYENFDILNVIPQYFSKMTDEEWNSVEEYIAMPEFNERLSAEEFVELSKLSQNDRDVAVELMKKFPNANTNYLMHYADSSKRNSNIADISYYMINSSRVIKEIVPEHLQGEGDDSLVKCLKKIFYEYLPQDANEIYGNMLERQLIPNLYTDRQLSGDDIYYLSKIPDNNWDMAMEYLKPEYNLTASEIYEMLK